MTSLRHRCNNSGDPVPHCGNKNPRTLYPGQSAGSLPVEARKLLQICQSGFQNILAHRATGVLKPVAQSGLALAIGQAIS
jgi:hypothetical protein